MNFLEKIKLLEKQLEKERLYYDKRYRRKSCKECEYKLICAGECEKTI